MKEYFFDTIKEVYQRLFHGRVRRKKFWMYVLWYWLFALIIVVGATITFSTRHFQWLGAILSFIGYLVMGVAAIPNISLQVRRLHDIGKSGWNLLLIPVPALVCTIIIIVSRTPSQIVSLIGYLGSLAVMLFFYCKDSQPGDNQYGPNPKGEGNPNSFDMN